ncbi:hypothetical protein EN871_24465 [bacterium M00.F.Ca.ET.228.01.1.1]|uniref:hypothetical protein n=1 Tax=Paraburkholderia phenoliruptrix TaxID=252970 RepID=UPI001092D76F|nr:hypothetical protein [Paraburkholderia phenoliruptrix]TGP41203.1 hypothetical protein EN871_24465 [bacterium M00.F.Ca.ET.228.01.1.1]TGR97749.1 hypothetical protein EN834_24080 [bacterium M00.F.Ca.ET.191.01.1.1]TGU01916.1 hypothetical protein EN798_24900 [bacterium M00.F.Ca.ET.155.01.1.1]MBW0451050.1 hypothetical protein [Paraburkholderia phenoliruptrix]MBW9101905.1 hypothetical protein [Paraburkholderia phenoliruptrix]
MRPINYATRDEAIDAGPRMARSSSTVTPETTSPAEAGFVVSLAVRAITGASLSCVLRMERFELLDCPLECLFCLRVAIVKAIPEFASKFLRLYAIGATTEIRETPIARDSGVDNIEAVKLHQDRGPIRVALNGDHCWPTFRLEANTKNQVRISQGKAGIASVPFVGPRP